MKTQKLTALVAAGVLGFSGISKAISTDTLAHLAANPQNSISIGDKTFNGFSYVPTLLTTFDPTQIQVTASIVGNVYYLTFQGSIALVSAGPAVADLLLNYTVTANAGLISMIDQMYTGSAQPRGSSFLAVDETVTAAGGGPTIANSHLQVDDLSDPFAEPGDDLDTTDALHPRGYVSLAVTKDIGLGIASANGGFVTLSSVSQSFHQAPEGGMTLVLLGFGLSGLALIRRKLSA